MSILDGLQPHCFGVCGWQETALDDEKETLVSLDDVREALLSPTDEQVVALADVAWSALAAPTDSDQMEYAVRAVLAAAAGGDQ